MKIEVQIVKKSNDKVFHVILVGHKNVAMVTNKRDVLNAVGEMMDSKCAVKECNCDEG